MEFWLSHPYLWEGFRVAHFANNCVGPCRFGKLSIDYFATDGVFAAEFWLWWHGALLGTSKKDECNVARQIFAIAETNDEKNSCM